MRFSLNTVCLFPGRSFEEIFPQMKERGFDTFELWSLDGIDLAALKAQKDRFGMRLSACCPSFFILNDERRHEEYEAALRKVAAQASSLDCPSLITQVGQDTGAPRAQQHAAILKGLRRMEPILREYGLTLLVEPLNSVKDHKGYYLTDSNEGFDLIREVDSPRVRLLYDIYHQHHMGEDVLRRIEDNLGLIGHYHIAGHPNRDEKIFENFEYRAVFDLLKKHNVTAPVGVELFPSSEDALRQLLQNLRTVVYEND